MPSARKAVRDVQRDVPHVVEGRHVRLMFLDLTSFRSIDAFVAAFMATGLPLHGLCNCAGPFYLTHLLLQKLTACAPARVVNVCSALGEYMGTVDWADLRMFTRELAVRSRGTGVDVFAVHPGFAATQLWHKSQRSYPATRMFCWAEEWFAQHPYYGALPALYALTEPELQGRTGLYLGPPLMCPLVLHTRAGDYWQVRLLLRPV
eukprot:XP_001695768.1 predicted protein [Chlamydomonas reinhardtii]